MCRSVMELVCSLDRLHGMNESASYVNNICFVRTAQYRDTENPPIKAGVLPAIALLLQIKCNGLVVEEAKVLVQEFQTCVIFRNFIGELAGNFTTFGE